MLNDFAFKSKNYMGMIDKEHMGRCTVLTRKGEDWVHIDVWRLADECRQWRVTPMAAEPNELSSQWCLP
jgi:hypothetical protein